MLTSNVINKKFRQLSAPITVHFELTSLCDEKCRHCYAYWRKDDRAADEKSISWDNLKATIRQLKSNKVFHVILTGGEPLLVFDKLLYAVEKCIADGMPVSVNSNLISATPEKMTKLKAAGLEHILTSVNSSNDEINDYIATTPGALKKIMQGIKIAQSAGIRVTPNMIVSDVNKDHVYKTGKFLHQEGINKFLANRAIPPADFESNPLDVFICNQDIARNMFNDLIRLREDYGMEVGTCRSVANCFFDDLEKYSSFIGRGCSAGKKHLLLNIDGTAHACVHESDQYGNIHQIGLAGVWKNMQKWRELDFVPVDCQNCDLFNLCDGGCRMVALSYNKDISSKDNLCTGPKAIDDQKQGDTDSYLENIQDARVKIKKPLNYRKEDGFYIFQILGAKVAFVESDLADLLIRYSEDQASFSIQDIVSSPKDEQAVAFMLKEGLIIPGDD